jgi:hypothetical protein
MAEFPAIEGAATVTPAAPHIAPAKADWNVNAEEKTSTATILGGEAVITRSPQTGKFQCDFKLEMPIPEEAEEGAEAGHVHQSFPLQDCENLPTAQRRAETLIRETLGKTHPELLEAATAGEHAEQIASAGPDPF